LDSESGAGIRGVVKTLVTGGSGFIGRHLIDRLVSLHGAEQVATVGFESVRPDVTHFSCDLEDEGKAKQIVTSFSPDQLYHLAGVSRVSSEIPFEEYFSRNYLTTVHLVSGTEAVGKPVTFFFASSVHVYGNAEGMVSEATAPAPQSPYGFSKYLAEQFLNEATQRLAGFRAVVARLYSCIGPGQARGFVASDLCAKIATALKAPAAPLKTGSLSAYRRFQDARDVVSVLTRLMDAPGSPFEVYNVASPYELQIKQLLEILLKEAGISPPIQSEDTQGTNPFRGLQVDTTKLTRLVPPSAFRPIEETLRDMLRHELSHPS
jgi:GDP-4-dehydro-6-deoxy-D-mannose reductase